MKLLNILDENLNSQQKNIEYKVGLSSQKAAELLNKNGKNQLISKKSINPLFIFFEQYKDILTIILLVCCVISVFMGEYVEAVTIAIIVLMNGILGFLQEYRTEKTLEALKKMAAPLALVYRDGILKKIATSDIVVGDIVALNAGDKVAADGILIEGQSLSCDEAMLTGESLPVKKEIQNDVFMGCVVTTGHGLFKVTATGMDTKMGSIALMLDEIEPDATPLQKKLHQLGKYIAVSCLGICFFVSFIGVLRGENIIDMLITGVSLAVAAVPEGLACIVTISLALSVSRMVKQNALVRKLYAVEALGCANVICSDKTGTLTQNKMTVTTSFTLDDNVNITNILECITLCNNANLYENSAVGEPTEITLLEYAKINGITKENLDKKYQRIDEIPFDSVRKRMSVEVENVTGQHYSFVKGAFDVLLGKCTHYETVDGVKELTRSIKEKLVQVNDEMGSRALRVLCAAYKKLSSIDIQKEDQLIFIGLVGMVDPPRAEVNAAVLSCHKASIKTVMITGDHKVTAKAIAKEIGIYNDGDIILTGNELDELSNEQLLEVLPKATVFARVSPSHKLRLVRGFKELGNVVAMTGDGVNDAPAIKEADIGVSMGITGTDVTKEAAELILLDDNFATLVTAVAEGRSIFENIRKFIRYLLACNIGEVITMFLGMFFGMPVILLPIQILLINLVTDGLPAIALGLEPSDKAVMGKPPRRQKEGVFSNGLASKIIFRGIFIGLSTLASFVFLFNTTGVLEIARTGALFTLILSQLVHVFECKSETKGLFKIPIFNNMKLILSALLSFIILIGVIYYPPLQIIFKTVPLTLQQVAVPFLMAIIAPIISGFSGSSKK